MILDAICAQRDRSVYNYFTVLSEEGDIVGLNAYDNDLAFDNYTNLKSRNYVLPPILYPDDTFVLPHMDMSLANKILSLNAQDITMNLKDLLDESQINATISRLNQMQHAIEQTKRKNPNFLLPPSEWNEQTIQRELSINGDTYFKCYVNRLKLL